MKRKRGEGGGGTLGHPIHLGLITSRYPTRETKEKGKNQLSGKEKKGGKRRCCGRLSKQKVCRFTSSDPNVSRTSSQSKLEEKEEKGYRKEKKEGPASNARRPAFN